MFKLFLFLPLIIIGAVFIILPIIKFVRSLNPKKDPVKEATLRLQRARIELEAARLNKETNALYEQLYQETIDDNDEVKNSNGR